MDARLHVLAVVASFAFLTIGCDRVKNELETLRGGETVLTVLAFEPLTISDMPRRFDMPLRVVGGTSGVCLTLRGGLRPTSSDAITAEFSALMKGASVKAIATTSEGKTVVFGEPSETWSKEGTVAKSDELAACMRAIDAGALPNGVSISHIELSSDVPLDVLGVYWESTNAWDKIKPR